MALMNWAIDGPQKTFTKSSKILSLNLYFLNLKLYISIFNFIFYIYFYFYLLQYFNINYFLLTNKNKIIKLKEKKKELIIKESYYINLLTDCCLKFGNMKMEFRVIV